VEEGKLVMRYNDFGNPRWFVIDNRADEVTMSAYKNMTMSVGKVTNEVSKFEWRADTSAPGQVYTPPATMMVLEEMLNQNDQVSGKYRLVINGDLVVRGNILRDDPDDDTFMYDNELFLPLPPIAATPATAPDTVSLMTIETLTSNRLAINTFAVADDISYEMTFEGDARFTGVVKAEKFIGAGGTGMTVDSDGTVVFEGGVTFDGPVTFNDPVTFVDTVTFDADVTVNATLNADTVVAKTFLTRSDRNVKDDIHKIEGILEKLRNLSGYRYIFKDDPSKTRRLGLIAQEVEEEFPDLVETGWDDTKVLDYTGMIPVLVEAIKELYTMVVNTH
jgi:hypothetical protein